jgi:hypothetical protein
MICAAKSTVVLEKLEDEEYSFNTISTFKTIAVKFKPG